MGCDPQCLLDGSYLFSFGNQSLEVQIIASGRIWKDLLEEDKT